MQVWIWLPPQYDDPRYAHTAFPALMLYPGGSGAGYNTWAGRRYGAREPVAAGHGGVTPFVFVMPEMQLSERLDTECADLPGQPKVGTFLAVDVRRMVEENFRVLRDRSGGAAGASSGAYCATRLVFDHPGQYRAVVSIGGYYSIETGLRGASDPRVLAGDPAVVARTHQLDVRGPAVGGGPQRGRPRDGPVVPARPAAADERPPAGPARRAAPHHRLRPDDAGLVRLPERGSREAVGRRLSEQVSDGSGAPGSGPSPCWGRRRRAPAATHGVALIKEGGGIMNDLIPPPSLIGARGWGPQRAAVPST